MHCTTVSLLAFVATVTATSSFLLDPLSTHQPNGNADGEVDYYNIQFNVTSSLDSSVATCVAAWGDNSWSQTEAYSVNVPTDEWISCTAVENDAQVAFQLYPYFSIGNFSVSVQQNYTDDSGTLQTATSTTAHITNTTSTTSSASYVCSIDGTEVEYEQHAQGDCELAANSSGIVVAMSSTIAATTCDVPINSTFVAAYPTTWGQNIILSGSIPALGEWDLSRAVSMVGSMPNPSPAWAVFTAYVDIDPGTSFEYKYVFVNTTGVTTWETGSNRQGTTSLYDCSSVLFGDDPDDVTL